ncbi:hypothetical protein [Malonomonas rubra]|nr:hypothetical protein [Malonomonas rubra]
MQNNDVRRWNLANLDYIITLYIARLTIFVLAASFVSRSSKLVLFLTGSFVGLIIGYFIISVLLMFVILIIRFALMSLTGKRSTGSPVPIIWSSEAWGFLIAGLLYIAFFTLSGFSVINPLGFAGPEFSQIGQLPLAFFAVICLLIVISFFLDLRFLRMVFAYVPFTIEDSYTDAEGITHYEVGPNPDHPDYEKRMKEGEVEQARLNKWKEKLEDNQGENEGQPERDKEKDKSSKSPL